MRNLGSKELHINNPNPPVWDTRKHYWEQSSDVLQYYGEEWEKITKGLNIGGYFFHPLLYFHINYFKAAIPTPVKGRPGNAQNIIKVPNLDDNMMYIMDNYKDAEERSMGMFLFGARGFLKTTFLSSVMHWLSLTSPSSTSSVVGGNSQDLNNLTNAIQTSLDNIHPAFYIPRIKTDWDKEVVFGIKEKSQKPIIHSNMRIFNADPDKKSKSEIGAGSNPSGFIIDEAGKFEFKNAWKSALPSFETPHGFRLTPVLSGTGGNTVLSKYAQKVLSNPESYKLIPVNWDLLERGVPDEFKTWERSKKSKFGTFVPGQMSYRLEGEKIKSNLSDFLGIENKALKEIEVGVTDWESQTKRVKGRITDKNLDEDERNENKMYYPLETADCFLTQSSNPFPTKIIDRHIRRLEDEGRTGKNVEITYDGSRPEVSFSERKRAEVSHNGGVADAPPILFGELPAEKPPKHRFVSGFDGYKLDVSKTDSLGSIYVIERRNLDPNSPCETIACSYTARPSKMLSFHKECERIIQVWNAECCMESADMGLMSYLDNKNKAEDLLAPSFSFSNSKTPTTNLRSRFGLYPTTGNNEYRFNTLVEYTKEEHTIGVDEEGNEIIKYGCEFIDDVDLLREMLNYSKGGNFDRITAFSHALVYARQLDKDSVMPKESKRQVHSIPKVDSNKVRNPYGNVRHKKY